MVVKKIINFFYNLVLSKKKSFQCKRLHRIFLRLLIDYNLINFICLLLSYDKNDYS
jgi:hypothetical protein